MENSAVKLYTLSLKSPRPIVFVVMSEVTCGALGERQSRRVSDLSFGGVCVGSTSITAFSRCGIPN